MCARLHASARSPAATVAADLGRNGLERAPLADDRILAEREDGRVHARRDDVDLFVKAEILALGVEDLEHPVADIARPGVDPLSAPQSLDRIRHQPRSRDERVFDGAAVELHVVGHAGPRKRAPRDDGTQEHVIG